MKNWKIRTRLFAGFGAICLILLGVAIISWSKISVIGKQTQMIVDQRVPTTIESARLVNGINASLAALRGWMLTGDNTYIQDRANIWQEIDQAETALDELSVHWSDAEERSSWISLKDVLAELRNAQDKVESIANSDDEQPATKILVTKAKPLVDQMLRSISNILQAEQDQPATASRKKLFASMNNVRAGLAVSEANLRGFLLSAEKKFSSQFNGVWPWVKGNVVKLTKNSELTEGQQKSLKKYIEAQNAFDPLATQMFEIRKSNKWNVAQYLLLTETAPRAALLMQFLKGNQPVDGDAISGLVQKEQNRLTKDGGAILGDIKNLSLLLVLLTIIGLISSLLIAVMTAKSIANPISDMTSTMVRLAEGDLKSPLPALERSDEVGAMAQAVEVFKINAIARSEEEVMAAKVQADISNRAERQNQYSNTFDVEAGTSLGQVTDASVDMRGNAGSMLKQAEQTGQLSQSVASAASLASDSVQTAAAASEQLSISIQAIQRKVQESTTMAANAVKETETTNEGMQSLIEAAGRIDEVVALITEIAEKTNLLALNATIEAARAGDAGKGFAVVATEVKNLANQTAKATEEVVTQVSDIRSATDHAVSSIKGISGTIAAINQLANGISVDVDEQGKATQEIATNMEQASQGTKQVADNIRDVQSASISTGNIAKEVLDSASTLSDKAELLRGRVETFLQDMRAA